MLPANVGASQPPSSSGLLYSGSSSGRAQDTGACAGAMSRHNKHALVDMQDMLGREEKDVYPFLLLLDQLRLSEGGSMSDEECCLVADENGPRKQMQKVVDILLTKSDRGYDRFLEVLQNSGNSDWIETLLEKVERFSTTESSLESVPSPQAVADEQILDQTLCQLEQSHRQGRRLQASVDELQRRVKELEQELKQAQGEAQGQAQTVEVHAEVVKRQDQILTDQLKAETQYKQRLAQQDQIIEEQEKRLAEYEQSQMQQDQAMKRLVQTVERQEKDMTQLDKETRQLKQRLRLARSLDQPSAAPASQDTDVPWVILDYHLSTAVFLLDEMLKYSRKDVSRMLRFTILRSQPKLVADKQFGSHIKQILEELKANGTLSSLTCTNIEAQASPVDQISMLCDKVRGDLHAVDGKTHTDNVETFRGLLEVLANAACGNAVRLLARELCLPEEELSYAC